MNLGGNRPVVAYADYALSSLILFPVVLALVLAVQVQLAIDALSPLVLLPVVLALVLAVQVQFVPPSECPLEASSNYVGSNDGSLPKAAIVPQKAFNRIIHIWLENTDFSMANATAFNELATQGIRLDPYFALRRALPSPTKAPHITP